MGRIPPRLNRSEPRQDQQTTTVALVPKGQQDFVKRRRPCENHQIRTRRSPAQPPKTNQNREAEIDSNPEKPRFRDTARRRKKMKKKSRITNPPPTIDRRGRGGGARGQAVARRSLLTCPTSARAVLAAPTNRS